MATTEISGWVQLEGQKNRYSAVSLLCGCRFYTAIYDEEHEWDFGLTCDACPDGRLKAFYYLGQWIAPPQQVTLERWIGTFSQSALKKITTIASTFVRQHRN